MEIVVHITRQNVTPASAARAQVSAFRARRVSANVNVLVTPVSSTPRSAAPGYISSMRSTLALATFALALAGCIPIPDPNAPMAHAAARPAGRNPLAGAHLFVDPDSNVKKQADACRATRPADAALLDLLASQPHASWFGEWSGDVAASADQAMMHASGAMPVLVVYNIPHRDCGQYSAGGAAAAGAYRVWMRELARGIGSRPAVVILEPDGLGLLTK